jgi:hypothetical protein
MNTLLYSLWALFLGFLLGVSGVMSGTVTSESYKCRYIKEINLTEQQESR